MNWRDGVRVVELLGILWIFAMTALILLERERFSRHIWAIGFSYLMFVAAAALTIAGAFGQGFQAETALRLAGIGFGVYALRALWIDVRRRNGDE